MLSVNDAAEYMLENGEYFTEKKLAKHFDVSTRRASSWLSIIKNDVKYRTVKWGESVKLLGIGSRTICMSQLQNNALMFKRPSVLL
ncbi:hypothetical protein [Pseudoalteromonas lipolytica]|uniref:Helix-turn-helix domain-containing protein n=1 Tax=Pseudoalteromonas lipolytica TaxID=570156 RepID=A0ABU8SZD1_9GAMM